MREKIGSCHADVALYLTDLIWGNPGWTSNIELSMMVQQIIVEYMWGSR